MRQSLAVLTIALAALALAGCSKRPSDATVAQATNASKTISSFDKPRAKESPFAPKAIKLEDASLAQVLDLYAEISGRSIIRGANLPEVKVTFSNQMPMSRPEALQALDTALAAQGVTMVCPGTQFAKAVRERDAHQESGPVVELPAEELPDSSSFLIYIVKLKKVTASQAVSSIQPFAKLPNSIVAMNRGNAAKAGFGNLPAHLLGGKDDSLIILRDYSSNVRRMLQVLEKLEEFVAR